MTKPLGYFTACEQGQALVNEFGDGDLAGLPQIDQAALLVALAGQVLNDAQGLALGVTESADDFVFAFDCYDVTDGFGEALDILEGVSRDEAIALIQFLTQ